MCILFIGRLKLIKYHISHQPLLEKMLFIMLGTDLLGHSPRNEQYIEYICNISTKS